MQICALGKPRISLTYAKKNVGKKHEDCAGGSEENNFRWQRTLLAPPPVAKGMRPEATNIDVWRAYAALSSTSGTSRSCHACVFPHFLPCRFCRRRLCRENIFCFAYWCSNHELQKESENLMSRGYRQPCYVDNWNPQHHEFRKFKNLQDPHDAWSHEGVVWRNTGVQTNEGH